MDVQSALNNIEELLLGQNSIPVQLRQRQGLNREKFKLLTSSIEFLIEEYKSKNTVPKMLALAFVDVTTFFYFNDDWYPPEVQEELEDAANELSALANQLFECP